MKTMLKQTSQSRLEARDGILCIVVETAFDTAQSEAASPAMRQWFRVEEPEADPALVAGRPVRNIDPQEGLFVDEEGNSYRLAGGGQAKPDYAEVIPVEGGPGTRLEAGDKQSADAEQTTRRATERIASNRPAAPQGRGEARRHCRTSRFQMNSRTGKS